MQRIVSLRNRPLSLKQRRVLVESVSRLIGALDADVRTCACLQIPPNAVYRLARLVTREAALHAVWTPCGEISRMVEVMRRQLLGIGVLGEGCSDCDANTNDMLASAIEEAYVREGGPDEDADLVRDFGMLVSAARSAPQLARAYALGFPIASPEAALVAE